MTTIQVRTGEQSVTINGEDLLIAMHGLFHVIAEGDHLVLQATEANAGSALDQAEVIREKDQDIAELEKRLNAQAKTIQNLDALLKAQKRAAATPELGTNLWNNTVPSDRRPGISYRVSLFKLEDGRIRGTCQCMDWYLQGLGRFEFSYKCKHIQREMTSHEAQTALRRAV